MFFFTKCLIKKKHDSNVQNGHWNKWYNNVVWADQEKKTKCYEKGYKLNRYPQIYGRV